MTVAAARSVGRIVVAGTPLGNPADASDRLRRALTEADVIAAEDTRRTRRLLSDLGVEFRADLVSLHEHNEQQRSAMLVDRALAGQAVVLVSDAGMPTISDPGYRLVTEAIDRGVHVTVIPGASAVTTALAVSGLPTDRFTFEGFLPRRPGRLAAALAELADERRTMVFFESPRRTATTLEAMAQVFGADRPAVVCRELTKTYEEVLRGSLGQLCVQVNDSAVLGEVTLVVAGASKAEQAPSAAVLAEEVQRLEAQGMEHKPALTEVARRFAVPKREVYQAVLDHRSAERDPDPPSPG